MCGGELTLDKEEEGGGIEGENRYIWKTSEKHSGRDSVISDRGEDPVRGDLQGYVLTLVNRKMQAVYRDCVHGRTFIITSKGLEITYIGQIVST